MARPAGGMGKHFPRQLAGGRCVLAPLAAGAAGLHARPMLRPAATSVALPAQQLIADRESKELRVYLDDVADVGRGFWG